MSEDRIILNYRTGVNLLMILNNLTRAEAELIASQFVSDPAAEDLWTVPCPLKN